MQQAAMERSALICQDLHPQAACCALFLDAILKDDWRLVRRAMKTLESMYDEELISPTEAGYVLCYVIPSNFRTVQSMDVPIGPDERLPYAQFVVFVAEKSFGNQPLAGSKAQLFFRTGGSVEGIANTQGSVYMIENYYLLRDFYFGVLKAASITLDFLDVVLSPSANYVGRKALFQRRHEILELAKDDPVRFIDIVQRYLEPLIEHVLHQRMNALASSLAGYGDSVGIVIRALLSMLHQLVEEGRVPSYSRRAVGRIALIIPYLQYHDLDDWSQRPFLRSVLQRVVKEGWLCQEEEEKACGAYQSLLKEKLAELCATNFATTSSYVYRIDRSRLARLIDMLAALDAKATGEAVATISRAVSACRNGSFGYVRYATARKRILDLFETMAEDFPDSVGVMSGWVGLDKQLDKAILKALSGKLNDLV